LQFWKKYTNFFNHLKRSTKDLICEVKESEKLYKEISVFV